ncbi:conjugal transfer protein TraR [Chromobacterium sinusclupearum]|jgi:phage/conjugal plasmid C-4 type zinc finger TraR family protein|uniref:Conjugal transfer protein TraR n=2 Tax=Chromobacterium TaxID=535 RepID=A0A2K4MQ80_9NEIS|nr:MULTISPECIES: TraR/DksA C4-type zinc finger protein [Chromobacterium]KIA80579.1 phage/conjugal plasmid C-4 type zinc finger protein, TraR family [Chromobacterium piscinae]MDE1713900.1 TraR/DksA C4-type zinc finger protein [Chromobacterium amazonense]POA99254.1 conjugal transfer protein TraR [Chromobacterium sinusclupearum]PRP72668.1 conjugal transfer protein TraR [Chromobacterium amazonense]
MSDFFDRASELETEFREQALARHFQQLQSSGYSHCEDCGEAIPAARRAAIPSCTRCVQCQQQAED